MLVGQSEDPPLAQFLQEARQPPLDEPPLGRQPGQQGPAACPCPVDPCPLARTLAHADRQESSGLRSYLWDKGQLGGRGHQVVGARAQGPIRSGHHPGAPASCQAPCSTVGSCRRPVPSLAEDPVRSGTPLARGATGASSAPLAAPHPRWAGAAWGRGQRGWGAAGGSALRPQAWAPPAPSAGSVACWIHDQRMIL